MKLSLEDILQDSDDRVFSTIKFDVKKVVRDKNICERFNLRKQEKVLAYHIDCKSIFSKTDIIFTDVGIHTLGECAYISNNELSRYIICPTTLDVACLLISEEHIIGLSNKNVVSTFKENQDYDLLDFVEGIQNAVVRIDDNCKQNRDRALEWFFSKTNKDTNINFEYSEYYNDALQWLSKKDDRAKIILLKGAILDFDIAIIKKNIANASNGVINELLDFILKYERDIQNPDILFSDKEIAKKLKNIKMFYNDLSEENRFWLEYKKLQQGARLYFEIRRKPFSLREDDIKNSDGIRDYESAIFFLLLIRNKIMLRLFMDIHTGDAVNIRQSLRYRDAFGLNILHYSIILGKNEFIEKCLKEQTRIVKYTEDFADRTYNPLDYALLAEYIGNHDLAVKINETIGTVGDLLRIKRSLERYIAIRRGINRYARSYMSNVERDLQNSRRNVDRSDYSTYVKYSEARENEERLKEQVSEDSFKIDDLEEDLRELEREIAEERYKFGYDIHRKVTEFTDDISPIITSIRDFYTDPGRIEQALQADRKKIKVTVLYGEVYFDVEGLFRAEHIENSSYDSNYGSKEERKGRKHDDQAHKERSTGSQNNKRGSHQGEETTHENRVEKPYGNSWFSPGAHKDYTILRKEYRNLAKKYHPDSGQGNEDIFKDINNERANIMESL